MPGGGGPYTAVGLATLEATGAIVASSAGFRALVGRTEAELDGLAHGDLVHPDDKDRVAAAFHTVVDAGAPTTPAEARYTKPDGSSVPVDLRFDGLQRPAGSGLQVLVHVTMADDATSGGFFGTVFARAAVSLAIIMPDGTFGHVNEAGCELTGYPENELMGELVTKVLHPDSVAHAVDVLGALLTGGTRHAMVELKILRKDGGLRDVEIAASSVYAPNGELAYLVGLAQDLTERHRRDEEVRHRAAHDHLTELPNRQWFVERLNQALARARRDRSMLGVFFVDLDGFKSINDELGHHAGDEVLFAAAGRISRVIRPEDTLARYGGDEFTILCENLANDNDAEEIARRVLGSFDRGFVTSAGAASLSASVGVALIKGGRSSPSAVLQAADTAMYEGKRAGKATFRVVRVGTRRGESNSASG
ncbi:MAG TPA: diguanylate cyclase [Acidimicrobiales bacterium]|nr:diguanylate cyclase [Acidimicrobiales bacterium]